MQYTVENISGLLIRSKLLSPEEVQKVYEHWQKEGKEHLRSTPHFLKWMVNNKYVTEYQATLISRGQADDFFLGPYKILDRLGKGRMAGVYRATHKLGQIVAIKVLPPSKAKDPQLLGRFQREARLSMKLKHPNVVRSFQVGEGKGLHYLVMEYLDGETLEDVLKRRKKLPPNEAVRLIYQALEGLQHIHENNFIHRDLKPANLMLVPPSPKSPDTTLQATVKILDIGLGREMFDESAQSAVKDIELTGEGVILGTPDYLAPEQARDPRKIDITADIYSLGCVLYHCLAGRPPFPDTNVINQMVRHATETPRPLKDFSPDIPDGVQQIMNWMLAKDSKKRYQTPERAAQALQVYMVAGAEVKPIEAAPQMKKYLTWLEVDDKGEQKERSRSREKTKRKSKLKSKLKKLKKEKERLEAMAQQSGGAPKAIPMEAEGMVDVELVNVPGSGNRSFPSLISKITSRDWILLGVGAGAVVLAVLAGMFLAQIFGN